MKICEKALVYCQFGEGALILNCTGSIESRHVWSLPVFESVVFSRTRHLLSIETWDWHKKSVGSNIQHHSQLLTVGFKLLNWQTGAYVGMV